VSGAGAPGRIGTEQSQGPMRRFGRSERVYSGLIRAYPARFRARYEDELLVLFRDQLRDARTADRAGGIAIFWIQTVRDLASSALGERLRKDRTMAQSLTAFEPTRTMRLLGLIGLVGGLLLLWAFVSWEPFATLEANTIRLLTFCLGGAAVAGAFYRRQAGVARSLTLATTGAVVVSGLIYAILLVLGQWVESPFSGTFGTINFWSGAALWLTAAAYGAAMLKIGAAWQGMTRWLGIATRLGAIALLGSTFAWAGDDRLGLVDSEQFGQLWSKIALTGVFLNGTGWVILGSVLAFGNTSSRRPA
jgi:hypothetical protein